jgi:hypothetical protein
MPLSKKVTVDKGKVFRVTTAFGFGWMEFDALRRSRQIEVPDSFNIIVDDFWDIQGCIVALLGQVIQDEHPLNGMEMCGLPVPYVDIDLDDKPGNYHLLFSPKRGHLTGKQPPPHYDSVVGDGYPEICGYAESIRRT